LTEGRKKAEGRKMKPSKQGRKEGTKEGRKEGTYFPEKTVV
jgi:hypothetical protein